MSHFWLVIIRYPFLNKTSTEQKARPPYFDRVVVLWLWTSGNRLRPYMLYVVGSPDFLLCFVAEWTFKIIYADFVKSVIKKKKVTNFATLKKKRNGRGSRHLYVDRWITMWQKLVPRVLSPVHLKTNKGCDPVPKTYIKPTMLPQLVHVHMLH